MNRIYAIKVMSPLGKFFLILTLFCTQIKTYEVPRFPSFTKNQSIYGKDILIALMQSGAVTENHSFVYAICDVQFTRGFENYKCNVNIETPAFYNVTYKDTCIANFQSEKLNQEFLSNMLLHAFGDDKVIFSWFVNDSNFKPKMSKVRIIRMKTCKYQEVAFPSEEAHNIVPNGNNFDIIIKNKTYCGSDDCCRLTFDSDGKKLAGPVPFLSNIKVSDLSIAIPAYPRQASEGFFIENMNETLLSSKIFHVNAEGKGTDLLTLQNPNIVKMSNSYDAFTVCYATEKTNITCKLYDVKMSPKLTVFFEFLDESLYQDVDVRWLQPHNLQDGGFLLVTGASDPEGHKLESFNVIKVNSNGQKERPLVIDGLDFECFRLQEFYVSVSENDDDEVCFYFICKQRLESEDTGLITTLKFSSKCLPKKLLFSAKYHASSIN